MNAYRKGLNTRGVSAFAVKKYKSHCRVGTQAEIICKAYQGPGAF